MQTVKKMWDTLKMKQAEISGSEGSVGVSIFLVMHRQQQHCAIFGCAFSFPLFLSSSHLSLPPFSWAHTSFVWRRWRRNKRGGELGHITVLKVVYFPSFSPARSPFFFCLPGFFHHFAYFSLLFPHFHTSIARLHTFYTSCHLVSVGFGSVVSLT